VGRDGRHHPGFEAKLAPGSTRLTGRAILDELFLSRETLEGHLWNKAYRAEFATPLFEALPEALQVPRANDLPVSLMLAAHAKTYVATKDKLYSYFFGSGGATDRSLTTNRFVTLVNFRPSYDVVAEQIKSWGLRDADIAAILGTMQTQYIARSTRLLGQVASPNGDELEALLAQWPMADVVASIYSLFGTHQASFLPFLAREHHARARPVRPVRTVGLYLDQSGIGGMQRVASLQARLLTERGYHVVLLARMQREEYPYALPQDCVFVSLSSPEGTSQTESLRRLLAGLGDAVEAHDIEAVMVHANYKPELIFLALGLRQLPVRSVLTVHSFALRAIFDRSTRFEHLRAAALQLDCLAVLSETDAAFWRLAGIKHVQYVPNPVDFTLSGDDEPAAGAAGAEPSAVDQPPAVKDDALAQPCDVLWFGRLDERVKRVSEVIRIFALVAQERPGARLHIVGPVPPSERGTLRSLQTLASELGVGNAIRFLPPTSNVASLLANAKLVLNTSIVEGFGYALVEPLIAKRPVVAYRLPYLAVTKDNPGIVTVPWGNREEAARVVVGLLDDDALRQRSARAGLAVLHERFSEDVIIERLRAAFDAAGEGPDTKPSVPDVAEELEHARVVIQQLFPLFHESLAFGTSGASAPSVEAFYRTWYGSRTIRYSERLGAPIIAFRRYMLRLGRRVGKL
jgi:glycosyltransferase involved in cell wall biosynthesis